MEIFRFREFEIEQNESVHKVGTDGVLLGAWTECVNAKTILDIGTGTGLLALMIAQKKPLAKITAIEIDENAFLLAKENFEKSKWGERIFAKKFSVFDFQPPQKFDLIICNPPFFTNSLKSPSSSRNKARHNDEVPFNKLLKKVNHLLDEHGKFSVIIPADQEKEFIAKAWFENLFAEKICKVKPKPNFEIKRSMILFGRKQTSAQVEEIIVESEKFRELTTQFYL